MSPITEMKKWVHHPHMPRIHTMHMASKWWAGRHFTTESLVVMAVIAAVAALFIFLMIWAYLYGTGPANEAFGPFRYYGP
ncbi:MAG: hypothetical protein ACYSSO_08760 [Planctomycetota bacterium]